MQPQGNQNADHEGYELFRRAIDQRDEQAWAESATRYRPELIAWAGRCSASAPIRECYADIADTAFARAWAALTLRPFASFPTLATLLGYLRTCVTSVVIDCARTDLHFDRLAELIEADPVATPEQIVLVQLDRDELWRIASSVAETAQQQCVLLSSYVYGLSPQASWRAIQVSLPTRWRSTQPSATCSVDSNTAQRCVGGHSTVDDDIYDADARRERKHRAT